MLWEKICDVNTTYSKVNIKYSGIELIIPSKKCQYRYLNILALQGKKW